MLGAFGALALAGCTPAVVAAPPPAPVSVPAPLPACGAVDVEDRSTPPSDARVRIVRATLRQKLAALAVCSRPYRIHVNVTVDQVAAGRLRARFLAVVYRNGGEMIGEIPTTLSAEPPVPEDRASREAELLKSGAESTALLFVEHFR